MTRLHFVRERLAYLKGLERRTEQQELFVLLAEKPLKTKQDEKKLFAMMNSEWASMRASQARQEVSRLLNAENKTAVATDRRAKTIRLVQQGILIDLAGLEAHDRGEILGALLALGASDVSAEQRASWKQSGDALLASKEKAQ